MKIRILLSLEVLKVMYLLLDMVIDLFEIPPEILQLFCV